MSSFLALYEAIAQRGLTRSLGELAALKARALNDLSAASDTEGMRRAFATLRLVREMRQDRIRDYRRSIERYRRRAQEQDEDAAYWSRLRDGLTTPEEEAAHRRSIMARAHSSLAEANEEFEQLSRKLAEFRSMRERKKRHPN